MLRKLYDYVLALAAGRHATASLAVVSFTESSFFPVPPDVMLAPMVFARPDRAYFYATVCTVASVLGALLGYAIGYYLEPVGLAILILIACVVTRGARFFIVAALIKKFGPQIQPVIEKRLALFTVILVAVIVGGFVALKLLH